MKKMFTRKYSDYLYKNKSGEVWLKRPSIEEWNKIKELIKSSTIIDNEGEYKVDEESSIIYIKYIYDNLTSQAEETKDMKIEDFINAMNKVIFELKIREAVELYRKIELLLRNISEEIQYDVMNEIEIVKQTAMAIDTSMKSNEIEDIVKETFEKHNINIDIDEIKKIQYQKEKLDKDLIKQ